MNIELFKKIAAVEPRALEMTAWELDSTDTRCGSTRCIAGWAIHLTTGEPLYDDLVGMDPSIHSLAAERGVDANPLSLGMKLLDLDGRQARGLFYSDNIEARSFLTLIDADRIDEAGQLLEHLAADYEEANE